MMERPKIRVAILGGGISGCVVARELIHDELFDVTVIERNRMLGGLHQSKCIDGMVFDIGPFLFVSGHTLFRSFPHVRPRMVAVISLFQSLTTRATIDNYPISIRGYYRDHGTVHCLLDLLNLAYCKIRYRSRDSLPAYVRYYLGSRLYRESGLQNYINRMYGIPDDDVALEFARQRMGLIEQWASLRRIVGGSLHRKKTILNSSPVTPNDLVRPPEGFEALYDDIRRQLESNHVTIRLGVEIVSIGKDHDGFEIEFADRTERYDTVVSTIPMESLGRLLGMQDIPELDYVPLFSLFYRYRGEPGFGGNLLHNFTQTGMWKRITMFSAMYGLHDGQHYFAVDGTIHARSSRDLEVLKQDFENHVRKMGIFSGELVYVGGLVTSHAYPVYNRRNLDEANVFKVRIQAQGVHLTGRQGEFDYISSADAAESAYRLASELRRRNLSET